MKTQNTSDADDAANTIQWNDQQRPVVPDLPIIPFIEGDGIGPDIWAATKTVLDAAVEKAYGGKKGISWREILAGEKAQEQYGVKNPLPKETLSAISRYGVALKGPLTTPVGGGFRSLNVTLRQTLDLYACVRPVRYLEGVSAPVTHPERVDVVIFRENTEDVYAGLEWPAGSPEARELLTLVNARSEAAGGTTVSLESAVGIKPMSKANTDRLVSMAIQYALDHHRKSVTLVHKGNIMKYTEGAFRDWGYDVARETYGDVTLTETDLYEKFQGRQP